MSARTQQFVLAAILAATVAGFGALYNLRLDHGDVFPAYSSLRADPLGLRALHDSLAEMPGLQVSRRFEPLSTETNTRPRTMVLAGFDHRSWREFPAGEFRMLDAMAVQGGRIVMAMKATRDPGETEPPPAGRPAGETGAKATKKERREKPTAAREFVDLEKLWGAGLKTQWLMRDARREPGVPEELPARLHWGSDLYFSLSEKSPWRVIYRRGTRPVLIERRRGRGSIVLAGDSYILSNEALQRDRAPTLLAWLVGDHRAIEFDESHLGVVEDKGVAALARSYGLAGALAGLGVLAGLFVWNRLALFVPPAAESEEVGLTYNQTAGLEALLRRAVPPAELPAACMTEWRRTARPADVARAEAAAAACPKGADAATIYNAVVRALRRR